MKTEYNRLQENIKYQAEMICRLINDPSLYVRVIDIINPDMFTGENRVVFDSFVRLIGKNINPDIVALSNEANIELEKIIQIATYYSGVPMEINSLLYELHEEMAYKRYMSLANFISNQITAGTDSEDIKSHIVEELRKLEHGNSTKVVTMAEGIDRVVKIIENNRKSVSCTGTPVGLKIIDIHTGGLQKGDLIILAGEVSHGKTALALSMCFNAAVKFGERCGIISLEMTPEQLTSRLAAMTTGISSKQMLTGKLNDYDIQQFSSSIGRLAKANIIIQDYIGHELTQVINAIRLMYLQHAIRFVVVENVGNITIKGIRDSEPRTAEISKAMKAIALELNITVLLISHLNRERENARNKPTLSRLKHSGQLEADADIVMFIYRPELHGYDTFKECDDDDPDESCENRCIVYVAKGRSYGLAQTFPNFDAKLTYVSDYEPKYTELQPNKNFSDGEPF